MLAREAATGHRLRAVVHHAGGDPQDVRGEHVQAAARDGDPEALEVIDDYCLIVRWNKPQYNSIAFTVGLGPIPRFILQSDEQGTKYGKRNNIIFCSIVSH